MAMRWAGRLRMAWRMLVGRGRAGERLDDELAFHLEQQIAENLAAGMTAEEARYAALRTFGNPAALRDEARATWTWNWLEILLRDVRIGVRTLARTPGFAVVAILVMAIGIGANVALFTVVRSVLLKPLPFPNADRLVALFERPQQDVATGDFADWQRASTGYAQMALWRWSGFNMTDSRGDLPEFVDAGEASWNMFATLGVQPVLGRSFAESDDHRGAARTAILTWSFFARRFNGDRSLIGRTIRLNAEQYTVIGVLPAGFNHPDPQIQLWVPFRLTAPLDIVDSHFNHFYNALARLKPGITAQRATDELSAVQHQLRRQLSTSGPVSESVASRPLLEDMVRDVKTPLYVLLGAVGCVLLIACLNISNLMVARAAARRREIAIRAALGSSRWRLCREQMTESALICVAGGLLGLAIATGATRWMVTHWRQMPRAEAVHLDGMAVAFALGVTAIAGLLAGLLPALSATSRSMLSALQDAARGMGGSMRRTWLRKVLLTVEIALTVILLVCAGLLFRSFVKLRTVDLGCTTKNVLTMSYFLRADKYAHPEQVEAFHAQLLERVRRMPQVEAAGLTSEVPGGGFYEDASYEIPEHPPLEAGNFNFALIRTADPGYFQAIGIPLIRGRVFTRDERLNHDKFVIINQQFVRESFSGENPIGKHLKVQLASKEGESYEIVGVVGDTLYAAQGELRPMMWFPILSGIPKTQDAELVVHSASNVEALAVPIQKQIAAIDPELPVSHVLTMEQRMGNVAAQSSFSATLVLAFAVLSLLLAAVGLYGVLAYLVAQRTVEIGIRIALGARRETVLGRVMLDGLRPALAGLVLGIAGSVGAVRLIGSVLFRTSTLDPAVFATVSVTLLLVASAACLVPAWRASRMDPMQALRME